MQLLQIDSQKQQQRQMKVLLATRRQGGRVTPYWLDQGKTKQNAAKSKTSEHEHGVSRELTKSNEQNLKKLSPESECVTQRAG